MRLAPSCEGVTVPDTGRPAMRILLVEDDAPDRAALRDLLLKLDPEAVVDDTGDGADAIRRLATGTYDLVVADLLMPRVDGVDVLKAAGEVQPQALRVMVSRAEDVHALERAINVARIHAYLRKAHAPADMMRILQGFLDEARAG